MSQTIIKWKCEKCGKEISSLYKEQLDSNKEVHLLNCNKKNEKNEMM